MRESIRKSRSIYGLKSARKFQSCTQMRRMLIKSGTLNMSTGQSQMTSEAWETRPCNAPLFGDAEQARGTCRSCFNGWTHPENYPV